MTGFGVLPTALLLHIGDAAGRDVLALSAACQTLWRILHGRYVSARVHPGAVQRGWRRVRTLRLLAETDRQHVPSYLVPALHAARRLRHLDVRGAPRCVGLLDVLRAALLHPLETLAVSVPHTLMGDAVAFCRDLPVSLRGLTLEVWGGNTALLLLVLGHTQRLTKLQTLRLCWHHRPEDDDPAALGLVPVLLRAHAGLRRLHLEFDDGLRALDDHLRHAFVGPGVRDLRLRLGPVSALSPAFATHLVRLALRLDATRLNLGDVFAALASLPRVEELCLEAVHVALGHTSPALCLLVRLLLPPHLPHLSALRLDLPDVRLGHPQAAALGRALAERGGWRPLDSLMLNVCDNPLGGGGHTASPWIPLKHLWALQALTLRMANCGLYHPQINGPLFVAGALPHLRQLDLGVAGNPAACAFDVLPLQYAERLVLPRVHRPAGGCGRRCASTCVA